MNIEIRKLHSPIVVVGNRAREFHTIEQAKEFKGIAEDAIKFNADSIDPYNDAYQFLIMRKNLN